MIAAVLVLASLPGVKAQSVEESAIYKITIDYVFSNSSNYTAKNVVARIYLFDNWSGWTEQRVLGESITLDGASLQPEIHDEADNRWARVELGTLPPHSQKTVRVTQIVKVSSVQFEIDPAQIENEIPEEYLVYTQPVPNLFESDDPTLRSLAEEITAGAQNAYEKALRIFEWILDNIHYVRQLSEHSALYALQTKTGDCTEFSNLFVAMARAAGIPAKVVSGTGFLPLYSIGGQSVDFNEVGHAWAIFYLPGYGWIPVDATWPQNRGSFAELNYEHITGAVTDGEGVVTEGQIRWPGPGQASVTWSYTEPYNPNVAIDTGGTVTPVLLLDLETTAATQIKSDGSLDFTVRVKNRATSDVSSVRVTLEYDPESFEAVNVESERSTLKSGEEWESVLTLRVRDNAYGENHIVGVRATYTSDYEGVEKSYAASSEVLLSIPPKPPAIVLVDYQTLLLLTAIAVAVGAIAGAVARKR